MKINRLLFHFNNYKFCIGTFKGMLKNNKLLNIPFEYSIFLENTGITLVFTEDTLDTYNKIDIFTLHPLTLQI